MKKKYIAPEAEILLLRLSDIIVASLLDGGAGGGDGGTDGEDDDYGDVGFINEDWN